MESNFEKYRNPILIASALFLIWGVLGVIDFKNYTHMGYSTDNNFNIIEVDDGSPAMTGGLEVGDHIKSIDGLDMEDAKAWNEKQRPAIGETRTWLVDRSGEEVEVKATYAPEDSKDMALNYAGFLLGLIFLASGIWIAKTDKSKAGVFFTIFALCFAFTFFNGPYIANPALGNIVGVLGLCIVMTGFAYLTYFMLNYPSPKSIVSRNNFIKLLFGPALVLIVVLIGLTIFQPDATQGIRMIINLLFGIVILFYFGWSLILMIQRYVGSTPDDRNNNGLNLMLFGAILGIVPLLFIILMNIVASHVIIPGSDYAFLFFALIPICFALAIKKRARAIIS